MKFSTFLGIATMVALYATSASGTLVAYEGFDYAAGTNVNGQAGGSGWTTNWTANGSIFVDNPTNDLSYTGLSTTGNSLDNPTGINLQDTERTWNAAGLTDDGDEVWFSLVVNVAAGNSPADNDELRFQIFQGGDTAIRNNGTDTMLNLDEQGSLELWGMSGTGNPGALNASTTFSTRGKPSARRTVHLFRHSE